MIHGCQRLLAIMAFSLKHKLPIKFLGLNRWNLKIGEPKERANKTLTSSRMELNRNTDRGRPLGEGVFSDGRSSDKYRSNRSSMRSQLVNCDRVNIASIANEKPVIYLILIKCYHAYFGLATEISPVVNQ